MRFFRGVRTPAFFFSLCVLLCASLAHGDLAKLGEAIDQSINRIDQQGILVAARVVDLSTGRVLFEQNQNTAVKPASNLKLFVTAFCLEKLGPDKTFETKLYHDQNDLVVVGTGDPAFGDLRTMQRQGKTMLSTFDEWADRLKAEGITTITGDLLYDDTALGNEWLCPSWPRSNLLHWYGAPSAGLNLNNNCIDIIIEPLENGVGRVSYIPDAEMIHVVNRTGGDKPLSVVKTPGKHEYIVSGKVTSNRTFYKPVDDPGLFFAQALKAHLARQGITIEGEIRTLDSRRKLRLPSAPLASHSSSMADVISRINGNSQNMMADSLLRIAFPTRNTTYKSAADAMLRFARTAGFSSLSKVEIVDGSGLSHDNRVTTMALSELLARMNNDDDFPAWFASFSVAGESGSFRNRMQEATGRIRSKSGSISGVRASSGYIDMPDGRRIAYSFIFNQLVGANHTRAIETMDATCLVIYNWDDWD